MLAECLHPFIHLYHKYWTFALVGAAGAAHILLSQWRQSPHQVLRVGEAESSQLNPSLETPIS